MRSGDEEASRPARIVGHAFDLHSLRPRPARHHSREAARDSMRVRRSIVQADGAHQRRERGQRNKSARNADRRNDHKEERNAEAIQRDHAPIAHRETCVEARTAEPLVYRR